VNMVIEYDPAAGAFTTIFSWTGTILQLVLKKSTIWFLLLCHGLFLIGDWIIWRGEPGNVVDGSEVRSWLDVTHNHLPRLDWRAGSVTTSLLIFFIVFYGSQSYGRFYTLYGHCIGIGGGCMEWTSLVKLHLMDDPNAQWNASRHVLAAMHLLYFGLRDVGPTVGIDEDEWNTIRSRNLLSEEEIETVKKYKGFKPFLPVHWAMLEAEAQLRARSGDSAAATLLLQQMQGKAFAFRGHCGQIVNLLKQPVPFPYFHLLSLMLILPLIIVGSILVPQGSWYLTLTIDFVICLVLLGLKEVAVCLADPFGDDSVDFNVDVFLQAAYNNTVANLSNFHEPCGMSMPPEISNPLRERPRPNAKSTAL